MAEISSDVKFMKLSGSVKIMFRGGAMKIGMRREIRLILKIIMERKFQAKLMHVIPRFDFHV
ncbi:MAG: hypothetical protein II940_01850 [Methanosarcinaceae archaeon]|nr:hypothetical protein [Methanosarcinaceae archaeon]